MEQRNDRIGRGRTLVDLIVIVAAAIVFNFFPQNVGVLVSATDPSSFIPLLAPEFQSYLLWLNTWWGVTFSLYVALLVLGKWNRATRWIDIARRLFGIVLLGCMVVGAPFVAVPWASAIAKLILAAIGITMLVKMVRQINLLLRASRRAIGPRET